MESVRVLVANGPLAYRGAIAEALRCLRPDAEVVDTDPEDLPTEASHLRPHLVVGDDRSALESSGAPAWILLYPDGACRVEICVAGRHTTATDLDFDDLLAVVDQVGQPNRDAPVA